MTNPTVGHEDIQYTRKKSSFKERRSLADAQNLGRRVIEIPGEGVNLNLADIEDTHRNNEMDQKSSYRLVQSQLQLDRKSLKLDDLAPLGQETMSQKKQVKLGNLTKTEQNLLRLMQENSKL